MSWIWENTKAEGSELLVLLALADHAGDDGRCYPSMTRIAARARLSLRGAQTAIRALEGKGAIKTDLNAGPKGCNRYTVRMGTPATSAPRTDCTPQMAASTPADNDRGGANGGIKPPQHLHPNRKEPSIEPLRTKGAIKDQDFDRELALNYWRGIRGKARYARECPAWARDIIESEFSP